MLPWPRMLSLIPLLGLYVVACSAFSILAKRDDPKVLSPHGGDRFITGIDVDIRWVASPATSVKLEVKKGLAKNLTTVHIITDETPNNGTYQWRSNDDNFLRALIGEELPSSPPSGCDYLIAVRDPETAIHSQYFTIINLNDDGLPDDAECPAPSDAPGTGAGTISGGGDGQGEQGGDGTPGSGDSGGPPPDQNVESTVTTNGVSVAMLGGAVGGASAGLLFIFALVLFLGKSRGWFVNREFIRQQAALAIAEMSQMRPAEYKYAGGNVETTVTARNVRSREINSSSVYQMPANAVEK